MKASLVIDTTRFRSALQKFASLSKKGPIEVVKQQAKLFIRDVVRVTPPAQGSLTGAKQRGEATLNADISHIFVGLNPQLFAAFEAMGGRQDRRQLTTKDGRVFVSDRDVLISAGSMASFHRRQRGKNGRVTTAGTRDRNIGRSRDHVRGVVPQSALRNYRRSMMRTVGILAGGWNASASRLGQSLPAWITRHGTGRGSFQMVLGPASIRIRVRNRVSFGANVRGFERRVRYAYRARAIAMERQIKHHEIKKAAKAAGLKVRG